MLAPGRQKRLALSTHQRVLPQKSLCYQISSALGYLQEIMDQIIRDLPSVVVYLNEIFVSGASAEEQLQKLQTSFQRLKIRDKGACLNNVPCPTFSKIPWTYHVTLGQKGRRFMLYPRCPLLLMYPVYPHSWDQYMWKVHPQPGDTHAATI